MLKKKSGRTQTQVLVVMSFKRKHEEEMEIKSKKAKPSFTITLTFSSWAENHPTMQKIGVYTPQKITKALIEGAKPTEVLNLQVECGVSTNEEAIFALLRRGYQAALGDTTALIEELMALPWDDHCFAYGKVMKKDVRSNLCFAKGMSQKANYQEKKGTVVDIDSLPHLAKLHTYISSLFPGFPFVIEGNLYHDITKCGIPAHGDRERPNGVVGVRLGASMQFELQAYHKKEHVGKRVSRLCDDGDIYFMTPKAAGYDCRKRLIPTFKHAAGLAGSKFLLFKIKKPKKKIVLN